MPAWGLDKGPKSFSLSFSCILPVSLSPETQVPAVRRLHGGIVTGVVTQKLEALYPTLMGPMEKSQLLAPFSFRISFHSYLCEAYLTYFLTKTLVLN